MSGRFLLALLTAASCLATQAHIKAALAAYQSAELAAAQKEYRKAADLFARAIQIEPTYLEAYDGLIQQDLALGLRSDVAAALTKALEIDAGTARYRRLLGQILLEQKQTERALAQFSLALETEPFNADALAGFAAAATQLGMKDRAAEALARGHQKYPNDKRFEP